MAENTSSRPMLHQNLSFLLELLEKVPHPTCKTILGPAESHEANNDPLEPSQGGAIQENTCEVLDKSIALDQSVSSTAIRIGAPPDPAVDSIEGNGNADADQAVDRTTINSSIGATLCLKCKGCRYIIRLEKLKRHVDFVVHSLGKLDEYEEGVQNQMRILDDLIKRGSQLTDSGLHKLTTAVMQLKFQLPSKSDHMFEDGADDPTLNLQQSDDDPFQQAGAIFEQKYNEITEVEGKQRLWCFAIFDGEVKKRAVINMWIGQEVLKPEDASTYANGGSKTLEEAGEDMLQELKRSGFIQQVERKGRPVDSWTIEPSARSFLRSEARVADFFDIKGQSDNPKIHLLMSTTKNRKGLTTRTVFNIDRSSIAYNEAEAWGSDLTVLHLGRSQITLPRRILRVRNLDLVLGCVSRMKSLRLLSLQGILSVRVLPYWVRNLACLRVLDLSECQALELLPSSIGDLKYLTHLDVSACPLLLEVPKQIGSLSNLEVLKGLPIGPKSKSKRNCCSLIHLSKLKKLHKLSILVLKENFPQPEDLEGLQSISRLVKLKILWKPPSLRNQQGVNPTENVLVSQGTANQHVDDQVVDTNDVQDANQVQDDHGVMRDQNHPGQENGDEMNQIEHGHENADPGGQVNQKPEIDDGISGEVGQVNQEGDKNDQIQSSFGHRDQYNKGQEIKNWSGIAQQGQKNRGGQDEVNQFQEIDNRGEMEQHGQENSGEGDQVNQVHETNLNNRIEHQDEDITGEEGQVKLEQEIEEEDKIEQVQESYDEGDQYNQGQEIENGVETEQHCQENTGEGNEVNQRQKIEKRGEIDQQGQGSSGKGDQVNQGQQMDYSNDIEHQGEDISCEGYQLSLHQEDEDGDKIEQCLESYAVEDQVNQSKEIEEDGQIGQKGQENSGEGDQHSPGQEIQEGGEVEHHIQENSGEVTDKRRKMLRKWFFRKSRNQVVRDRKVFPCLEKLDLWCAPDDNFFKNSRQYPKLKKLYIRAVKFDPLENQGTEIWQNVEVLRLLYVPELKVEDVTTNLPPPLFPKLEYLQHKKSSDDDDFVWVKPTQLAYKLQSGATQWRHIEQGEASGTAHDED